MSKFISDLHPSFQAKARKLVEALQKDECLKKLGVENIAVVETKRELSVQMAYYSRGRMNVDDVKAMYKAAGLYDISTEEAKKTNTWTLKSRHLEGLAIDLAPVKNGKCWWDAPKEVLERMGEIGEECGLSWGGRWKEKDFYHFQ